MNTKNTFNSFEKKAKEQLDYIKNLSKKDKEKILESEKKISEKIKLMLDNIDLEISDINTSFRKNHRTKDNELINVYYTIFTSSSEQRPISVITDAKTMKMLYVKTPINRFTSIEEFFDK